MNAVDDVRARHRELHGDAPLSDADARAVAATHQPVTDEQQLAEMAAGRLPMPPYLLPDGTPVVLPGHLDPVDWAGGADRLHDWYVGYWPEERRAHAESAYDDWMAGRHGWLHPATPRNLRRVEQLQAQTRDALDRLAVDPRDPVGRGSLAEAVDGLDELLRPALEVEAARHGGTSPREEWVDRVRRDHLTPEPPPMPIRTERLLLRDHRPDDAEQVYAYYGREDVARYLLGEASERAEWDDRYREWAEAKGRVWGFVIEYGGRVVGDMVLMFRGPSQAELGWVIHPDVGGRGIATEAARALLEVGFGHFGFHRIWAALDGRNGPSARLCERIGMRLETHKLQDYWSKGEWTDTLEYGVLASEWEAVRASSAERGGPADN